MEIGRKEKFISALKSAHFTVNSLWLPVRACLLKELATSWAKCWVPEQLLAKRVGGGLAGAGDVMRVRQHNQLRHLGNTVRRRLVTIGIVAGRTGWLRCAPNHPPSIHLLFSWALVIFAVGRVAASSFRRRLFLPRVLRCSKPLRLPSFETTTPAALEGGGGVVLINVAAIRRFKFVRFASLPSFSYIRKSDMLYHTTEQNKISILPRQESRANHTVHKLPHLQRHPETLSPGLTLAKRVLTRPYDTAALMPRRGSMNVQPNSSRDTATHIMSMYSPSTTVHPIIQGRWSDFNFVDYNIEICPPGPVPIPTSSVIPGVEVILPNAQPRPQSAHTSKLSECRSPISSSPAGIPANREPFAAGNRQSDTRPDPTTMRYLEIGYDHVIWVSTPFCHYAVVETIERLLTSSLGTPVSYYLSKNLGDQGHPCVESSKAERRGSVKGDTATRIKSTIAAKRKALNWRAVFSSCCVYLWDFQRRPCYFIGGKSVGRFNACPWASFVCVYRVHFEIQRFEKKNVYFEHSATYFKHQVDGRLNFSSTERSLVEMGNTALRRAIAPTQFIEYGAPTHFLQNMQLTTQWRTSLAPGKISISVQHKMGMLQRYNTFFNCNDLRSAGRRGGSECRWRTIDCSDVLCCYSAALRVAARVHSAPAPCCVRCRAQSLRHCAIELTHCANSVRCACVSTLTPEISQGTFSAFAWSEFGRPGKIGIRTRVPSPNASPKLYHCTTSPCRKSFGILSLQTCVIKPGNLSKGQLHHRGSKLDLRSDLRSTLKTVAPFEFRAGLEIEIKLISNRRNWRFEISIRDQQPSKICLDESESQKNVGTLFADHRLQPTHQLAARPVGNIAQRAAANAKGNPQGMYIIIGEEEVGSNDLFKGGRGDYDTRLCNFWWEEIAMACGDLLQGKLALAVCCTLLLASFTLPPLELSSAAEATGHENGKESAMAFDWDPSQHSPGVISENHGNSESGWPDRELNPGLPECQSSELPTASGQMLVDLHLRSIDVKHIYSDVAFAIGTQLIRHVMDDSEPIADLQGNKQRMPYCQVWCNTGYSLEQQLMNRLLRPECTQDCGV
ncbi:hypothetical protein PR048_019187 [Dryococelus australis]|uniref:Uncharacterized protein n=1 Tax=Dryococelus australis TaxID=614101 RepID=A0ABQ9H2T8_9NEOP|nr:hypothetical protein PR048_019187 [Dryococelus australis]